MTTDRGDHRSPVTWDQFGKTLAPIRWDWPGWLPRSFLTVLASQPGAGKSLLCLHLAACYLQAGPNPHATWPDGAPLEIESGKIIWCESEAGHVLNLDRARRFNLDLSRILIPQSNPLDSFRLDVAKHAAALVHHARRPDVRLVVLDSLRGLRSSGRRRGSLADFARVVEKPVLLTHHLRKRMALDGGGVSLDRLLGASGVAQTARVVWAIDAPDPAAPQHRRLSVIKNNLASFPEPLGLTVDDQGRLHFGPPPRRPTATSELDRAAAFLLELLAAGPLPFAEVESQARASGHSLGTLRRAKKHLAIASIRPSGRSAWHWALPQDP